MPESALLDLFAVTAPGLEPVVAGELRALGIEGVEETGGVGWSGPAESMMEANLRLRTASRVLVRVGSFRARTFFELERKGRQLPWERFASPARPVRLRVTARKSRLYHEGAIAERLLDAIERGSGARPSTADPGDEEGEGAAEQLFVVRFLHDRCTISADASGALLHLRGYRQAVAKAPLRETMAAAMILASGWDPRRPLVDPMCGSGTLAIEAALLAREIAPGLAAADRAARDFAFLAWPGADGALWEEVVSRARERILPDAPAPILASDRDAGAVRATEENASRAGVEAQVESSVRALGRIAPPEEPGWLLTNPPYGVRVGETRALRDLYAGLGNLARAELAGWRIGLLSADRALESATGLPLRELLRTRNGGIPVRLMMAGPP